MRFKDVFSIIGPSMIGPSSSHTAGAVRIGRVARHLAGGLPEKADIYLYGSFAETYRGHGTDLALAGGLMDFHTDDARIKDSLELAEQAGMEVVFHPMTQPLPHLHPNTARLVIQRKGNTFEIAGCSIGGGNIEIVQINGYAISFTANYPTLLIFHEDRKGMIALMTHILQQYDANIGFMKVERKSRSGDVLTVIELDDAKDREIVKQLRMLPHVRAVHFIHLGEGERE
ncbi:L-serine ammonia-lyase, iron-sulfur-dependent, subunit beta [Paenibacillus nanensis]|uniref:L-serine deaminase n=1 Tax=Paenibacillus nanensis TaxID=393251 RepID=A0A3A1UWS0_9BACL|nr:L-serine ammonia-lyase, iron-sulfur-dependent subunit beta [Paenibacillus nanensis]RIX49341.1 L-serine ammonia-lyase, iron-sulfur-dependent, subunit beta [Paenibacillus nanensis]